MVDSEVKVRDFLMAQPSLVELTGNRIYVGTNLPPTYRPVDDGEAILFVLADGTPSYSSKIFMTEMLFRCYAVTPPKARALDGILYDVLDGAKSGVIKMAVLAQIGVLLKEPEVGWELVLSRWNVILGN